MRRYKILLTVLLLLLLSSCGNNKPEVKTYAKRDDNKREMDMIVWYDIDHGSDHKNQIGWWPLNPQHPNKVKAVGLYRSTTPLLGLYNIQDETTVKQHLYWISALACNAITCDWTNYSTYRLATTNKGYLEDIYLNTESLLKTAQEYKDAEFSVPKVYTTIRLYEENYDDLKEVLDDCYTLYEKYSNAWYKFDGSNKPFIVIFADWNLLNEKWINEDIPFKDERFDIRWSNGHIKPIAVDDGKGNLRIPAKNPYWLFVEEAKDDKEGYYKVFYKEGKKGEVEQMVSWTAIYNGWSKEADSPWDGMDQVYDGKTTFERSLKGVKELSPKALLVNRFNYPTAWKQHPYEGISLYDSVHIEPNKDFGFQIFNNVMTNLYDLNYWIGNAPDKPDPVKVNEDSVKISISSFPLEYRVSATEDFEGSEWEYLNINNWISYSDLKDGEGFYLQTRNPFGVSETVYYM